MGFRSGVEGLNRQRYFAATDGTLKPKALNPEDRERPQLRLCCTVLAERVV